MSPEHVRPGMRVRVIAVRIVLVVTAFAVLYGCGRASSPAEDRATTAASGFPNDNPVPEVVGRTVLAACRELRPDGYIGAVVGEVRDDGSGPSRVVAQEPEAGRKGREGQLVRLTVTEPYPAGVLEQNPECLDRTQLGPGGKPNDPN
jgi:PASTA domain